MLVINNIIITSPSLNPEINVSGISSVTNFIINKNDKVSYHHFEIGKKDNESSKLYNRITRIISNIKAWKVLLKNSPRALIHYNMPLMGGAILRDFLFLQYAHIMHMPIILHIHGGYYMKKRKRPFLINKLLIKIFSWSKSVIVLSEEEKRIIEEDFKIKDIIALPNCIDLSEARTFKRHQNSLNPLSILYLGRIEKNKGIDYILEAAKIMKERGINYHLHFAGKEETENEYIPLFKETLGDKFKYHGVVFKESKTELLKKCNIFLLPSLYEGLPMSLIESMSFGEVPIVTNVGSISSIVKDNTNGFFIKLKNAEDIAAAILKLSENHNLLYEISNNASSTIFKIYDENLYIDKLNNIYYDAMFDKVKS